MLTEQLRKQQISSNIRWRDRSARSKDGRSGAGVSEEWADGWVLTKQNVMQSPHIHPARSRGGTQKKETQSSSRQNESTNLQNQQLIHTDHALSLK